MTTNPIVFPKNKLYLRNFIIEVLKKDNKMNVLIANRFYELLHLLITTAPLNYAPHSTVPDNAMVIELPKWKNKNPEYYFYLSLTNQQIIQDWLYKTFFVAYNRYMIKFNRIIEYQLTIEKFMEDYNIDDCHFDMLKKHDWRYRKGILSKKHQKILALFMSNRPL